jgi:hypothetical protein
LPLKEFAALIGQPQEGVLRGAPRHSTIDISPWGLQTEFPESHLVKDMAIAFNSAVSLDAEIKEYEGMSWAKAKQNEARTHLADLHRRAAFYRRMCVLSCFNLIEAYINGVAWDFRESHDISGLSKNKQDVLTSGQASILDKVVKIPESHWQEPRPVVPGQGSFEDLQADHEAISRFDSACFTFFCASQVRRL